MSEDITLKQTISDLLGVVHELGISCYIVVPSAGLSEVLVKDYWDALSNADTLKYRWSDEKTPTVAMAVGQSLQVPHMYSVIEFPSGKISSEFSLGPFSGKAAQVHFSKHPTTSTETFLQLAEKVADMLLYYWPDLAHTTEPMLTALLGITPTANRAAVIFIRKVGFKPLGVIPGGTMYLGAEDDALLTLKTRN